MIGKIFIWLLAAVLLIAVAPTEAQQTGKVPRIGVLEYGASSSAAPRVKPFQQGLRDLGYVEGKNIIVEYRYAELRADRLSDYANELVRLKVEVIFASADVSARAAKEASNTIPIVFATATDPVRDGFVSSLARPGGNLTGLSLLAPELNGKRIELLKEAFPKITKVGFVRRVSSASSERSIEDAEVVAKALGLQLQAIRLKESDDINSGFEAAKRAGVQALAFPPSVFLSTHRERIISVAATNKLPAIYSTPGFVDAGGLMSYGPDVSDNFRRAATYVDKILKGAKPSDLPVEQPTKFEFVINLKAAKQIGVTIPPNVLARADRVIK
jgi:putative tryptophan/tyrosine transport system substrate-binding protein